MKLILAEKPSVAKNIADALQIKQKKDGYFEGNNYIITWAFGHLLQLYDAKDYDPKMTRWKLDNFPFIPNRFQYKVKTNPRSKGRPDPGANKQLKLIHALMKRQDVDAIISATDYDREGQLIGDSIIYKQNINKPIYRLLLNEWTAEEVLQGLENIRPNKELRPLLDAGMSRQWADWIIGINLTSVTTLKYQKGRGNVLNVGRVLLPTLKIIYDRDQEINKFVPEDYYMLSATFQTKSGDEYEGTYTEDKQDRFDNTAKLKDIEKCINGSRATIIDKQVERKKEFPPFLFNLSNLQGYVTSKYKGWTSDKVLKVAQSLYEKKYITYPRTASVALDESLVGKTAKVLQAVTKDLPYQDEIRFVKSKRVFNNKKVESHSAIIPTYLIPRRLTSDQQIVYSAIKNRFVMQFMPVAEYEETRLVTKINDLSIDGYFLSKGRVQLAEGWKKVENIQSKENLLPHVNVNQDVTVENQTISAHKTKPPKPHTEKTLLRVMETCGRSYNEDDQTDVLTGFSIGTPATRAETIKKLKDVGYILIKNKNIHCSDLGIKLVEMFPITSIFDLEFTGRLEKSLADMEKNQVKKDEFLDLIYRFTNDAVATIKSDKDQVIHQVTGSSATKKETETLGKCPACGHPVIEGKKGFGCSNWKNGCKFVVWKNDKFLMTMKKRATKTMVKSLLKDNVVYVKGLTSKQGKKFNAYLRYEKNPLKEYYSWKMDFNRNKN